MAKEKLPVTAEDGKGAPAPGVDVLYEGIRGVLEHARSTAYRAVNFAMVQAYWQVGRLIVEHEQGGEQRAAYGEAVIAELSRRLTAEFGRGFDIRNLRYMRQFHQVFAPGAPVGKARVGVEIRNAVRSESAGAEIRNAVRSESPEAPTRHALRDESADAHLHHALRDEAPTPRSPLLRPELCWTHYRLLLGVSDPKAREWYMHEAADQHWSTRQLERQISVLYYERLLSSREKAPVRKEAEEKLAAMAPEEFIRDPLILGFLNLRDYPWLRASKGST